jgi:ABC-type transport system involved in multi-copper enzyme maturation permease subunit
MFLSLVHRELIGHILSLRFAITFSLVLAVVGSASYVGGKRMGQEADSYTARGARYAEELQERRMRWPGSAWGMDERRIFEAEGVSHAVALPPLAGLVQGVTEAWPQGVTVTATASEGMYEDTVENPLQHLLRRSDFGYIVGVVLSLLAVVLVFDSVSGEKESGTLRATLANAVPRQMLLLSKWIAAFVLLLLPLLIASAASLAYGVGTGSIEASADNVVRAVWLSVLSVAYVTVFICFGLFVSVLTHRAVTALWIGLFGWALWVLVYPSVVPTLAEVIAPTISERQLRAEQDAVDEEMAALERRLVLNPIVADVEAEKTKLTAERKRRVAAWDHVRLRMARRQTAWAEGLAKLSPFGSWSYAASTLAQTGPDTFSVVDSASQRLVASMAQLERDRSGWRRSKGDPPELDAEHLPRLSYALPSFTASLDTVLPDLALLILWNLVFLASAFLCFLRYDVR